RVVDLQDANPGAIVDRRELIQPAARARDPLEKLHVQLQSVTGLGLLVALPALAARLVLLIRRETRHAMPRQDAVHRGGRDSDLVEAMQIRRDPACAEVIVLAQIENFTDDLPRRCARRPLRCPRAITEAGVSVFDVTPLPLVERFPRDPEPTACS